MWNQRLVTILAIVLTVGVGVSTVFRSGPHQFGDHEWGSRVHRSDFTVYRAAGASIWNGENIYEAHNVRGWSYLYLPTVAVAMAPFAWINIFWGSLLWYLLSAAMFAHTLYLSALMARKFFAVARVESFWLIALVALITLPHAMSALARGQASVMVTYLTTLSVWFYLQRREWSAGFCLAGAIVVKLFPAVFLLYFAGKRRWGMLTASAVGLIMLIGIIPSLAFGVHGNVTLLQQWVREVALPSGRSELDREDPRYAQLFDPRIAKNQSVQAVTTRWLAGGTESTALPAREPLARRIAIGINVALALCTAYACRRRPDAAAGRTLLELCAVTLLSLFVSPVTWSHYYTLLAMPLAVTVVQAANGNRNRAWKAGLCLFAAANLLTPMFSPLQVMGLLLCGTLIFWAFFVRDLVIPQTGVL
jgi:alpha-1,2-mannosyltransferase